MDRAKRETDEGSAMIGACDEWEPLPPIPPRAFDHFRFEERQVLRRQPCNLRGQPIGEFRCFGG